MISRRFHAVVLQGSSSSELVKWLADHGYAFSPEVEAWAKPYVAADWKITALKVADPSAGDSPTTAASGGVAKSVSAAALRMSFKTEQPLFPYREPDPTAAAKALQASHRLLRIYFLADGRYRGTLTPQERWSGQPAWSGKLSPTDQKRLTNEMNLPDSISNQWWLTEFEDTGPIAPHRPTYILRETPINRPFKGNPPFATPRRRR